MGPNPSFIEDLRQSTRVLVSAFKNLYSLWPLGDANLDGKVDKADLDLVNKALRSKPGDANWNSLCDFNMDGLVDGDDVAICGVNQGVTLPPVLPAVVDDLPYVPDASPAVILESLKKQAVEGDNAYGLYLTGGAMLDIFGGDATEIATGRPGWRARVERSTQTFLAPFTFAAMPVLRAIYQAVYRPTVPGIGDLQAMLLRGHLTPLEYLSLAGYLGLPDHYSVALLEAAYQIPGFRDLQVLLWRGEIDDVAFKDYALRSGIHPDLVEPLYNLAWSIPGPTDLIRFVVREVISPADFITWIGRQGFSSYWASAYWDAHFVLPAPNFLYEAFHRGIISDAELRKYIFWHDYQPTTRPGISKTDLEIMRGLTKTLIPRVDLRRAWERGLLTDQQLIERYEWLGYEDDAEKMAEIQKAVAMDAENNAIATAAAALYRDGYMDRNEFEGWLRTANFSQARIDKTLAAEDLRRRRDLTTDLQAMAIAAFQKDIFTEAELHDELVRYGMEPDRADVLVAKEVYKKLPKPKAAAA